MRNTAWFLAAAAALARDRTPLRGGPARGRRSAAAVFSSVEVSDPLGRLVTIGFTAHEAPGGSMLLLSESHVLEVLDEDGRPCAPGEPGEAVITGLTSAAQPFIRYRTGDVVALADRRDPGGRGLHVLDTVDGRQTDFVVHEDGTIMHALAVIYVLRAVDGIDQFKCVQHTRRNFEVLVVPNARWSADSTAAVVRGLQARLGDGVAVEVRVVDAIAPEASGKHRYVVSHVPPDAALASSLASHADHESR